MLEREKLNKLKKSIRQRRAISSCLYENGSYNYSDKITNGTSEDDFINIDFYEYYDEELEDFVYKTMATVNADAGNDYIQDINWCSESFISGGNGNDTILSLASRKYPIRRFWR